MRAREYRFPRIDRTDSCSSGRQFLRVTTLAPWQLMSMVGAISDDGLSGLLSFTNIFNGMRCSFRLRSGVRSTSSPLGRGVQHRKPTTGEIQHNGTKGQRVPRPQPAPTAASIGCATRSDYNTAAREACSGCPDEGTFV